MMMSDHIEAHGQQIGELQTKLGLRSIEIYEPKSLGESEDLVFVVDLDPARPEGYADRYFETMFGLQRIFAHPVDMWEKHMFEQDPCRAALRLVPLDLKHAA